MNPTEFNDNQILLLQNNNNHHHNKSNNSQTETPSYKENDDNQAAIRASRYTPTFSYSATTDVDGHYILDTKMNQNNIAPNHDDGCGGDRTSPKIADDMILFQELTPKKRRTASLLSSLSLWDEKWLLFHNNNHYKHHHHHHMSPKMIVVEKESRSYCPTMATNNNNNNNDDVCDVGVGSAQKYMNSSIHVAVPIALFDDSTRQRRRKKNKKDNVDNDDDGHGGEPRSASILSSRSVDFIIEKDTRNHHHQDHQQHHNSYRIFSSSTNQRFYDQFIIVLLVFILYFSCSSSPSTTHFQYVNAIRSIRIMAPDYIFYGDPMWLNCSVVDLDYNQIYSIKWFKDNDEMYRFITADESPTTFYETPGIVIDEQRSNYGNLYVSRTGFRQEADFRCEVLAENDFNTVIQIKKIKVYYIPRDGQPIIVGKKSHFGPNEPVNLTCTSPMSTPAARLMVNLNGNSLIGNNQIQTKTYHRQFENGQSSTSVNVQFPGSWLQAKKINQFECTSSIIHRFNRTASLRLELRIDHSAGDNHTAFFPVLEQSNHYSDRLTPRIENYKEKYEIGDQISLRCISAQYKPMPELYWLKDGQPMDAQYLDYKQNDYHINGFVRLDLKYRLSLQNHKNLDQQQQSHHNNGHARHSFHQRHIQHHNGKRNNINGNKKIDPETKPSSMTTAAIDSYHFECVQVLSNVISVSSEVVQLYGTSSSSMSSSNNHESEQSLLHHGNSVEAVKSLIGNGSTFGSITTLFLVAVAVFLSVTFQS